MMMMYMAWPAEQGRRRINLTAEASRSMDGWMAGWEGNTGLNKRPPEKSSAARILALLLYPRRPETADVDAPLSLEYRVQGATTHKKLTKYNTSAHTRTHALNLTSCRGATNVQPTYRPSTTTHKALSLLLDRLSLQDPRQQTTVGRAENFCLGRLHLHRARPRRPLSLNLTTHGLLLLLLRLLLLLYGEPASQPVTQLLLCRSGSRSVLSESVVYRLRTQPSTLFHLPPLV